VKAIDVRPADLALHPRKHQLLEVDAADNVHKPLKTGSCLLPHESQACVFEATLKSGVDGQALKAVSNTNRISLQSHGGAG
jgi:hypothetical protein